MNIAHVSATYPPYRGGTGRVCADQAAYLSRRGHTVTVYCPAPGREGAVETGPPRVVRTPTWLRVGNAAVAPGHLGIPRPDILHLHYPYYGGGDFAWLDALIRRIPYVVTYHQDVELPGALGIVARRHHALIGQRQLAGAKVVMATSLDYARHSRLAPLLRRTPERVVETPNGVDTERFFPAPRDQALLHAYGIPSQERVVVFVGSLDRAHYFKGVDVLIQAVAELRDVALRLFVIGRGELSETYAQLAATLGIAGRVRFLRDVDDDALPAHIRLADVLVLPSRTRGEAFGVVLLEALASGVPVIASDLPGVRSVVTRTKGGLLVPAGDAQALALALSRLLTNDEQRVELGRQGCQAVERLFAWPRVIDQLERVYRRATE